MSKIPQDYAFLEAMRQYGWEPKAAKSFGNVWRIKVEDGIFALKRAKASREKLLLLHRILEKIGPDFPHLLPWVKTQEGSPIVDVGKTCWYATPWKDTKEAPKVLPSTVIKSLASFHRLSEPVIKTYRELQLSYTDDKLAEWQHNGDIVSRYSEKREAREFQSPFDKYFSRNEETLEKVVDFSIRGMERFFELEKGKPPRFTLCHKRFHPRHLMRDEQNFYFINFDHAQVESPVQDIATCLRRLSDPGDDEHPLELIEAYEANNKLLPMEKKLLALHLAYPERLLKTVHRYYGEGASYSFSELTALRRLEKEVNQLEQFEELIKTLWNSKKAPDEAAPQKVARNNKRKKVRV